MPAIGNNRFGLDFHIFCIMAFRLATTTRTVALCAGGMGRGWQNRYIDKMGRCRQSMQRLEEWADSADMCAGKFLQVLMGDRVEGLACADPGAVTPISASGNSIQGYPGGLKW
jgi:hypothetical protein